MMTKNYQVNIAFADYEIVVEANSVDEASTKAFQKMADDKNGVFAIDRAYLADCVETDEEPPRVGDWNDPT